MSLRAEIRNFLKEKGIKLTKKLGQHFLADEKVLAKIIETADIKPKDHVIEIGPGIGILTRELLKKTSNVTAIEIDPDLIPLLKEFISTNSLKIINADALDTPFPQHPYKIVASIPYQITSPLLKNAFIKSDIAPTSLTLLIQKEVAEKIIMKDGGNRIAILVHLFGSPRMIRTVRPRAFIPPPKVDSAILHIDCFDTPRAPQKTLKRIFDLSFRAFTQRRKMLRSTIDEELLLKANIDPTRRPQTLSIEEWIRLGST